MMFQVLKQSDLQRFKLINKVKRGFPYGDPFFVNLNNVSDSEIPFDCAYAKASAARVRSGCKFRMTTYRGNIISE